MCIQGTMPGLKYIIDYILKPDYRLWQITLDYIYFSFNQPGLAKSNSGN